MTVKNPVDVSSNSSGQEMGKKGLYTYGVAWGKRIVWFMKVRRELSEYVFKIIKGLK